MPVAFLGNRDVKLYVSRRADPMPFYYRNADGDELIFVHRGHGVIETDFGPMPFETRRLHRHPARRYLPHPPRNRRTTSS